MDIAYTAVLDHEHEGKWTLGVATENERGYSPIKHDDPATFYKAKGPTIFDTYKEAQAEADRKNEMELHLTKEEAMRIVISSIVAEAAPLQCTWPYFRDAFGRRAQCPGEVVWSGWQGTRCVNHLPNGQAPNLNPSSAGDSAKNP